ncbi:MAG: hypothetical protein WC373_00515 [Smithella sp.]|jgi:pyruvate,orthophosphate dikinase
MANKNNPIKKSKELGSSALKVNLERTAVTIEIPEHYSPLLKVAQNHYGLQKKTRALLTELNHPFVNWEYVLKELKSVSIGDFHIYNNHQDGLSALSIMLQIYLDIIESSSSDDIKDNAIHYLFYYVDTILTQSNELLPRNLELFDEFTKSIAGFVDKYPVMFKKSSSYMKKIITSITEKNLNIRIPLFESLAHKTFKMTYQFWLAQPDPSEWLITRDGETKVSIDTYRQLIQPLSHEYLQILIEKLEFLCSDKQKESDEGIKRYLDCPD